MFSQTTLGVPNYYYETFFKTVSTTAPNNLNGHGMAELIANSERSDMYQSLVCVDNSRFDRFSASFESFLSNYQNVMNYQINNNQLLFYYGQIYFDLESFIRSFKGVDTSELIESLHDLIVMNKINPASNSMQGYSGLSLLAMQKDYLDQIGNYDHLSFFKTFRMNELFIRSMHLLKHGDNRVDGQ